MYIPFFQYGCALEINSQRTAAYIRNIADIAADNTWSATITMECDCDPLRYTLDVDEEVVEAVYTTPAGDSVAWYDPDIPESSRFLGFMIEDFVMNSIASRTLTTRLTGSGGGTLGPIRNKERRMDFTVLLFAADEVAMEYGFRYLTDVLGSPGCDDDCTNCDAEYRDSCHQIQGEPLLTESYNEGRWILKNVGHVTGPDWGDPPVEGAACNVRRVTFSLASELPWKFKCPVVECEDVAIAGYPSAGVDCANWDNILCGETEVSCSISEDLVIGETGMQIEITAGDIALQHVKIAIRPDPFGYECNEEDRPDGYTRTDPCDLIYILEIPANNVLVYNTALETMSLLSPGGGIVDATYLIATEEGRAPTFPTLRCGQFCVSVSASECSVVGSPSVTIRSQHREI